MNAAGTSELNEPDGWSSKSIFQFIKKSYIVQFFHMTYFAGSTMSVPLKGRSLNDQLVLVYGHKMKSNHSIRTKLLICS